MKILVTGSNGFVGKNLISNLKLDSNNIIYSYDTDCSKDDLNRYTKDCDFVYHLAGVNRPNDNREFMSGNFGFTSELLSSLIKNNNICPIMMSSSIQAELDNDYGKSKKAGEELIFDYGKKYKVRTYIFRFPNLFGKWCKPNYNSVIATWCNNIANGKEIVLDNPHKRITLAYIDDVCNELIKCLNNSVIMDGKYCIIPTTYTKTLDEISELLKSFKQNDKNIMVPLTGNTFIKALYATYVSYVPIEDLIVNLDEHRDDRGVFCEFVRTKESGQVSISTTNPKVLRGGHYHNTKMERFMVIKGEAEIEFEHVISHEKFKFHVSENKLQYVTIPVGYQHKINNIGDSELIMILWANELFDSEVPDTYVMEEKNNGKL